MSLEPLVRFTFTVSLTLPATEAQLLNRMFEMNARNAARTIDLNDPHHPCTIVWDTKEARK